METDRRPVSIRLPIEDSRMQVEQTIDLSSACSVEISGEIPAEKADQLEKRCYCERGLCHVGILAKKLPPWSCQLCLRYRVFLLLV